MGLCLLPVVLQSSLFFYFFFLGGGVVEVVVKDTNLLAIHHGYFKCDNRRLGG